MKKEMYGTITLDISRITDCKNHESAEIESQNLINELNIEEFLLETMNQLGLKLHNASVDWEDFYSEEE